MKIHRKANFIFSDLFIVLYFATGKQLIKGKNIILFSASLKKKVYQQIFISRYLSVFIETLQNTSAFENVV